MSLNGHCLLADSLEQPPRRVMVLRTVVLEEATAARFTSLRETHVHEQKGLLLGNLHDTRDHVIGAAEFPKDPNHSGDCPHPEWAAEHCRQVDRMLPGGVSVVGIYVLSSKMDWKASWINQVVRKLKEASGLDAAVRLVMHCDARTGEYKM